ncbi:MAG: hypothetical protein AAGK04_10965, partial [Planctomycetota bacterium]
MQKTLTIAALIACCGVAAAQDSVSTNPDGGNGLPGDALDPFAGSLQTTSYVLDLADLTSSWGNNFAIGPVAKLPKLSGNNPAGFFNNLPSGNSVAQDVLTGVNLPSSSYAFWDVAGAGVNTESFSGSSLNTAGTSVSATDIENAAERLDQVAAHLGSFSSLNSPADTTYSGVSS